MLTDRGTADITETAPRVSQFRRFWRVFLSRKLVAFGLFVIATLVILAIFAPLFAPYDPYKQNLDDSLLAPSLSHPLGADSMGRDTLSRIIYGTRTSLMIGIIAIGIAATIGMTMGLVAGYFGGVTYVVIMRFVDALMSIPMILKALVLSAMLPFSGLQNVMIALGIGMIPAYARLMCGQVLTVRENDYVTAGRAIGASNLRIMLHHILPNCFPPLIVMLTLMMGTTILAEASLSFLGLGIDPPGAAWGAMVSDGRSYILTHPVLSFAPGVAIMLVVFAFNMVGDGLRDALDPRLRGTV